MAREVLSNGVINPDKYQADWYADLSNNWNLLNNLIGSAISSSEVDSKIATAIQELMIRTFQIVTELPVTGTEGVMYLVLIPDTSKYTAYVWENNAYRELGVIQMTITIDDELSTTSENPAQNKVITNALNNKAPISHTHSASDITSGLSAVATSGSYNDLSNKPTIPTVNNATLTIQRNGITVDTFTANASVDKTININTADDTKIPLAGSNQISGDLIPATDNAYDLGDSTYGFKDIYANKLCLKGSTIFKLVDDSFICLGGATAQTNGANLVLNGKDLTTNAGFVFITANDGTQASGLQIRPNGDTLLTNCLVFYPNTDNSTDVGAPAYRYKVIYAATGTINTSDSRLKNSVKDIDDKLLDAWENIEPKQYKFNDATKKKGEKARYHTGYLAQDVQAECEKQGINASDYGLFCYDEWDEQEEVSEEIETEKDGKKVKEKRIIQTKREKGNIFALRYEEALIVECAYLRKKLKELTARIEELEKGNNSK